MCIGSRRASSSGALGLGPARSVKGRSTSMPKYLHVGSRQQPLCKDRTTSETAVWTDRSTPIPSSYHHMFFASASNSLRPRADDKDGVAAFGGPPRHGSGLPLHAADDDDAQCAEHDGFRLLGTRPQTPRGGPGRRPP